MYLVVLHGQGDVLLARLQRGADRVQGGDEVVACRAVEQRQHLGADPRHDPHGRDDVLGVGDLHAEHRLRGGRGAHAERDDVHGPAAHAPAVQLGHHRLHLRRLAPVVGDAGVGLQQRADEGALLDPRDVVGVGRGPERVRLRREPDERARLDEAGRHPFPLLLGPVAPHDPVRRGQLRHLAHPGQEARVLGRGVVYPWHGRCGHVEMPPTLAGYADPTSGTLRAPAPGRAGEQWVGVPKPYLRPRSSMYGPQLSAHSQDR